MAALGVFNPFSATTTRDIMLFIISVVVVLFFIT